MVARVIILLKRTVVVCSDRNTNSSNMGNGRHSTHGNRKSGLCSMGPCLKHARSRTMSSALGKVLSDCLFIHAEKPQLFVIWYSRGLGLAAFMQEGFLINPGPQT